MGTALAFRIAAKLGWVNWPCLNERTFAEDVTINALGGLVAVLLGVPISLLLVHYAGRLEERKRLISIKRSADRLSDRLSHSVKQNAACLRLMKRRLGAGELPELDLDTSAWETSIALHQEELAQLPEERLLHFERHHTVCRAINRRVEELMHFISTPLSTAVSDAAAKKEARCKRVLRMVEEELRLLEREVGRRSNES